MSWESRIHSSVPPTSPMDVPHICLLSILGASCEPGLCLHPSLSTPFSQDPALLPWSFPRQRTALLGSPLSPSTHKLTCLKLATSLPTPSQEAEYPLGLVTTPPSLPSPLNLLPQFPAHPAPPFSSCPRSRLYYQMPRSWVATGH